MKVYYDRDADLSRAAHSQKIAIIGFGSQGHAHALNLRDSGMDVRVGLRKDSPSWEKAAKQGLPVFDTAEAAQRRRHHDDAGAGRDGRRKSTRRKSRPQLTPGKYLAFGHGFNIHFKFIKPPTDVNVFMIAPKGPGHLVRSEYVKGRGVPCLLAVAAGSLGRHQARSDSPTGRRSAADARRLSRPAFAKRPRPICSASSRCCAAA